MKHFAATVLLFLVASLAHAADVTVTADMDPKATGVRVYLSTDGGVTFPTFQDGAAFPMVVVVPDTGRTDMKLCALNATAETCRQEVGIWYDADKAPLSVQNLGTP